MLSGQSAFPGRGRAALSQREERTKGDDIEHGEQDGYTGILQPVVL